MTAGTLAPDRTEGPWRAAARHPALRRILPAYGVSKVGDLLYITALLVVLLQQTGSAAWVCAGLVAHVAPQSLITPFAGVLADRMDRRRLMVLTDLGRLVLMVVAAGLVAAGAAPAVLVLVALLAASIGTAFPSALMALLPEVVEEDRLPGANAVVQVMMSAGYLVGPVLATLILRADLPWLPFAVNALTFAFSALMLSGVRRAARPGQPVDGTADGGRADGGAAAGGEPEESFGQAFRAGVRLVLAHPGLRVLALTMLPGAVAWGMAPVYLPLVSRDLIGTGESGLGLLTAASGLGGVLAAGVAARLAGRDRLLPILSAATLVSVLPIGLLALVGQPLVAYGIQLVDGLAMVCVEVVWMTALQRMLPLNQVARVDGLFVSLSFGCSVLGMLATPVLVEAVGLRPAMLLTLLLGASGAVAGVVLGLRVATTAPDRGTVELLRRVPALEGLEEAGFEVLARAAGPMERVPAGTRLLTAGDPATEVLVLVSGEAEVVADAPAGAAGTAPAVVNQVAGPDLLGEIGVIRQRPRTASVVTTTPVDLRRIPAEAFAGVLVGDDVPTGLTRTVSVRLARWAG